MAITEAGKTRLAVFNPYSKIGTLDDAIPDSFTKLITCQGNFTPWRHDHHMLQTPAAVAGTGSYIRDTGHLVAGCFKSFFQFRQRHLQLPGTGMRGQTIGA